MPFPSRDPKDRDGILVNALLSQFSHETYIINGVIDEITAENINLGLSPADAKKRSDVEVLRRVREISERSAINEFLQTRLDQSVNPDKRIKKNSADL